MSPKILSSVPTKAGLYWWRPSPDAAWIMVSFRGAPGFPPHAADDVSGNSFYGRPVSGWRFDFPVGEWIEVLPPAPAGSPEVAGAACSEWPARDIVRKLIEAADLLLDHCNYDGHGWEEIHLARSLAHSWAESPNATGSANGGEVAP